MKDEDEKKRKLALQKQQLDMAQRALQQRQNRQRPPEAGWPNPIPNNTVSPIMELPSENNREEEEQFVGYRNPPPTAYNTNEQKFLVSDDIQQTTLNNYQNYPVINPNASPQQIGSKISRVMSMDGANVPVQSQQPPQQIRSSSGDDAEDFSDLFN
jgi:hypothetical protein